MKFITAANPTRFQTAVLLADGTPLDETLHSKADKTSVNTLESRQEAAEAAIELLNEKVPALETEVASKASQVYVDAIEDELTYSTTITPDGGADGNLGWKFAKFNGKFIPDRLKLDSISMLSRTDTSVSSGVYIAIFQRQADNPSTDASTWEFKGMSSNAPTQQGRSSWDEWTFNGVVLEPGRHFAYLATTNPELSYWQTTDAQILSQGKPRSNADDFSELTGIRTLNYVASCKLNGKCYVKDVATDILSHGGAVTKDMLASSTDEDDKIPTIAQVKSLLNALSADLNSQQNESI